MILSRVTEDKKATQLEVVVKPKIRPSKAGESTDRTVRS